LVEKRAQKWYQDGTFLRGVMSKVTILKFEGKYVMANDGKHKLSDGKSTVASLLRLQVMFQDHSEDEHGTWPEPLLSVMRSGMLSVRVMEFPYNDPKHILSWNVVAHDEKTNELQSTSVLNMAELAFSFQKATVGGKWQDTLAAIEASCGRRNFAHRCVILAQTVKEDILTKADEYAIAASWIQDNKSK
jgi:hypothetical protein